MFYIELVLFITEILLLIIFSKVNKLELLISASFTVLAICCLICFTIAKNTGIL